MHKIIVVHMPLLENGGIIMFMIFQEEIIISAAMVLFLVLSILTRLGLGLLYQRMINETDNMAVTNNKLLKQCKLKFANCFQLNNGVANIPVFVDKFLNRLSIGRLSFNAIYHLSGQFMLLSVVCSGIGVCKSIIQGRMVGELLPFYIVSFLGLYVYFSVATVVDISGKRRALKTNLVDYLENHLSAQIHVTRQDINMLYGENVSDAAESGLAKASNISLAEAPNKGGAGAANIGLTRAANIGLTRAARQTERQGKGLETGFTKEQEKELEKLLMEFLA